MVGGRKEKTQRVGREDERGRGRGCTCWQPAIVHRRRWGGGRRGRQARRGQEAGRGKQR